MLQEKRLSYVPKIPQSLERVNDVFCQADAHAPSVSSDMAKLFPHLHKTPLHHIASGSRPQTSPLKVGVVFSGGPAPGGHNVLTGLFDALTQMHPASELVGFLGGFSGILKQQTKKLTAPLIQSVRNQGGFDLIGTGRTKIESKEDFEKASHALKNFDALVVVGGDDSNTNGALLAEYLLGKGSHISIIGVPKTIDGDLRSSEIEISFGFDSACKTYAELIGNLCRDALSTRKYYHFVKLMGRAASHIALECALATQPNLTLIGEERRSLQDIVQHMTDVIVRRKAAGKEYGVFLIPEGLIEFIPEMQALKSGGPEILKPAEKATWDRLPDKIQSQLLSEKDPHGNVRLSQIATEELLILWVKHELAKLGVKGFDVQEHFFGYEGRSCLPTNFDANYAYALGRLSALAVRDRLTGVICAIRSLHKSPEHWVPVIAPLVPLFHIEERLGEKKPVIAKVLVDIKGASFIHFSGQRTLWEIEDCYRFPGPVQFFGAAECTDSCPRILRTS